MKLGAVFPQLEIGDDPGVLREYAQAVQDLGYEYLLAYDHVLGAGRATRPGWSGPYDADDDFHEPFTLFSWLAAVAPGLELVTGVIVLPQRQTALVAKQAAQVDILTGGRFRLGVGVGWNEVEYEALGQRFGARGRRANEQIALLRRLWTEDVVTFEGEFDRVVDAGIRPLPVQRPIPVWVGGTSEAALARAGRLGDGWLPQGRPTDANAARVDRVRTAAAEAGRDPAALGVDARVDAGRTPEDEWAADLEGWRRLGATHVSVTTMNAGHRGTGHVEALRRFREVAA